MCIPGIQLDVVHVWDRHWQALFVFPALSSHVSANNGCNTEPCIPGAHGGSWEQGMEDGDKSRSRGWNGMELGETSEPLPVPEGAALELERDFRQGRDRIRGNAFILP